MNDAPYRTYRRYLAEIFPFRVQKVTLGIGTGCPNRDGTVGSGGCIYCDNASFSPTLNLVAGSVTQQIEAGKNFFRKKYPDMRYIAYFQSYTNTHSASFSSLMAAYREAMAVPDVAGIVIGTRPDCIPDTLLHLLRELSVETGKPVLMEYGAETSHDSTLARINRCHTVAAVTDAVARTRAAGLDVGLHFIMGLPGETRQMMRETVRYINTLDIQSVKFHQLQIIKGTKLAEEYLRNPETVHPFTLEEYLDLCREIVSTLDPRIAIERFTSSAPATLVIAPKWGLKNYEFTHKLNTLLI